MAGLVGEKRECIALEVCWGQVSRLYCQHELLTLRWGLAGVKLLICAAAMEVAPAARLVLQANSTFRCEGAHSKPWYDITSTPGRMPPSAWHVALLGLHLHVHVPRHMVLRVSKP